jgi:hypothetical protein
LAGYARNGERVYGPEAAEDVLRSKQTFEPPANQYAAVEVVGPLDPPKKRLRSKKPSLGKPFDPRNKKLALA